jgi:hypothetical protein
MAKPNPPSSYLVDQVKKLDLESRVAAACYASHRYAFRLIPFMKSLPFSLMAAAQ